jgi:hypothetical protein
MIVTFQPLGVGEVSSSIAMGDLLVGGRKRALAFQNVQ